MQHITAYAFYIFILLLSMTVFYVSGSVIFYFLRKEFEDVYTDLWSKLTIGSVAVVTMFAVIYTSFKSIFVISLLVLIFLIFINSKKSKLKPKIPLFRKINYKFIFEISLVFLVLSVLRFIYLAKGYPEGGEMLYDNFLTIDLDYYQRTIDGMLISKNENVYQILNVLEPENSGISLYHFFEMWIVAMISFFSGINTIMGYSVVLAVFSYIMLYITYHALASAFRIKINIFVKIILLILLFVSGFTFDFVNQLPYLDEYIPFYLKACLNVPFWDVKRGLIEWYWLSFFIVFIEEEKNKEFPMWAVILLCVISISNAPAALITGFLLNVWYCFRYSKKKIFFSNILLTAIFLAGLFLLLFFFRVHFAFEFVRDDISERLFSHPLYYLIDVTKTAFLRIYSFSASFMPFVIFIYWAAKKYFSWNFVILLLLLLFSSAFFGALTYQQNWSQFFNVPSFPIFRLCIIFSLIAVFELNSKPLKYVILCSGIFLSVYAVKNFTEWSDKRLVAEQDFSDSFIEKIKINETSDYCFGVFWKGKKEILSYSQSPSYNIFASKLHFSLSKIIILNFSDIKALQEASFMDKILASYISNEAVYYLHKAEGKSKAQRSEKEFYFSFFKKMNIKFVILDNDAEVPEYVFEYFNGERVVDAKSGAVLIKKK